MTNVTTKKKEEKKQDSKVVGKIPINDDVFNQIKINIGREKKMVNTDVFKTTIEEDLKEIQKCKIDILILQRQNEESCKKNNDEITRLNNEITCREEALEHNLSASGERKIETTAGWCAYRAMPDKWEYDDDEIIGYCKLNKLPYYHTVDVAERMKLKTAILTHQEEYIPGVTVTPQEPKFNYKLNGGL